MKPNTCHFGKTKESAEAHQHDAWEPEWIDYVYSYRLECTNSNCGDTVASTGTGSVTQYTYCDEEGEQLWRDLYSRGLLSTDGLNTTMTDSGLRQKRTTGLGDSFLQFSENPSN